MSPLRCLGLESSGTPTHMLTMVLTLSIVSTRFGRYCPTRPTEYQSDGLYISNYIIYTTTVYYFVFLLPNTNLQPLEVVIVHPMQTHSLLTSEYWCEQSGDDTASVNREVKEREKPSQEILLKL